MATLTTNHSLKKPVDADNADLKVYVGENMDLIDSALATKVTKDGTGKVASADLPTAGSLVKGAVQVGNGLGMSGNYILVKVDKGLEIDPTTYGVKVKVGTGLGFDATTGALITTGEGGGTYTLQPATDSTLGGIKVGTGLSITTDGVLSADGGGGGSSAVTSMFSATSATSQAISAGGVIKLIFGTEQQDLAGEYDPTTGRFTASTAGTYVFSGCMRVGNTTSAQFFLAFYKNGVADSRVQQFQNGSGSTPAQAHGNSIMKLNAGDYIEVYGYCSVATSTVGREALSFDTTFFRGVKIGD
ncbi:hypothetical protein QFZ31_006672 [Neobacillus niacini]|uniref:C1q-like domain-containing protein n=1 Tax=Neobacillus driksii TaxID=3035913 RepID=UPI00277DDF15|nr:hypothetical protein [Neobacillus niacini]MDQ0976620.1 hypothetical protein [Neobacillus niacini]